MLVDANFCGYCIHYYCEENEHDICEYCELDKTLNCSYNQSACDSYEPDQKYINSIMGGTYGDNS